MTAMPTFTTTHRVQFSETDMAGIVHFAEFYRYMEEAEHEYFRSLNLSIMQKQSDGSIIGWPRVRASCSFEAPAYFEDEIEIQLSVVRKGVKSLSFEFEFFREQTRLARGKLKTACCHFQPNEPMKSIPIPAEYDEKIHEVTTSESDSDE
jgi:YbgC/YbaW family acyl-CoA thioester hydrolase